MSGLTGSEEAMVDRIVHLGFEVRVELTLADGSPLIAQLTRAQVEELELAEGQIVYVLPSRAQVFDPNGRARRGPRSSRSPEHRGMLDRVRLMLRGPDRLARRSSSASTFRPLDGEAERRG